MNNNPNRAEELRDQNRAKLFVIDKGVLWSLLENLRGEQPTCLSAEGIPTNAIIDNVGWDLNFNGVVYRMLHEDFDQVEQGVTPVCENVKITAHNKE